MKPKFNNTAFDGLIGETETWLFDHTGFTTRTEWFHQSDRQSRHENRVLNFFLQYAIIGGW